MLQQRNTSYTITFLNLENKRKMKRGNRSVALEPYHRRWNASCGECYRWRDYIDGAVTQCHTYYSWESVVPQVQAPPIFSDVEAEVEGCISSAANGCVDIVSPSSSLSTGTNEINYF